MFWNFNVKNIRFEKIHKNKNERFKHDYKNMFMSEIRWKITFNDIFFAKIHVSWTKLRNTRQKTVNYRDNFENMNNICEKNVEIHHIDELQKIFVFHNHKKIELKTDQMIKKIRTIQIYDSLYVKQKQRQNKYIKQIKKIQKKNQT